MKYSWLILILFSNDEMYNEKDVNDYTLKSQCLQNFFF